MAHRGRGQTISSASSSDAPSLGPSWKEYSSLAMHEITWKAFKRYGFPGQLGQSLCSGPQLWWVQGPLGSSLVQLWLGTPGFMRLLPLSVSWSSAHQRAVRALLAHIQTSAPNMNISERIFIEYSVSVLPNALFP